MSPPAERPRPPSARGIAERRGTLLGASVVAEHRQSSFTQPLRKAASRRFSGARRGPPPTIGSSGHCSDTSQRPHSAGSVGRSTRLSSVTEPGCSMVLTLAALSSCSDDPPRSVSVVWTDLSLSSDRRTITVTTAYPIEGDVTCAKEPDGISIRLDERQGVAQIDARMRRRAAPGRRLHDGVRPGGADDHAGRAVASEHHRLRTARRRRSWLQELTAGPSTDASTSRSLVAQHLQAQARISVVQRVDPNSTSSRTGPEMPGNAGKRCVRRYRPWEAENGPISPDG